MAFTKSRVKDFLNNELLELEDLIDAAREIGLDTAYKVINEIDPSLIQSTLLHETVRSRNTLERKQNIIRTLIQIGADPLLRERNGDTALHTAVSVGASDEIFDALLHTEHEQCRKGAVCFCGLEALKKRNNRLKLPKEDGTITFHISSLLTAEELLYAVKSGDNLSTVYRLVKNKDASDLPESFPRKLIACIIANENDETNEKRYLAMPLMFHFCSAVLNGRSIFLDEAFRNRKWKSFFMINALIELNNPIRNEFPFLNSWSDPRLNVSQDILPHQHIYTEEELAAHLKRFINKESLGSLISLATSLNHPAMNRLLKVYCELRTDIALRWNGLNLKRLDMNDSLFGDISKKFIWLDLSDNRLERCPLFYVENVNFHWHQLQKVDLSDNRLTSIDVEIFNMRCLQELRLNDNHLSKLPNPVKGFTQSLRALYLKNNQLVSLPSALSSSLITSLDLENNKFESLPKCICNMLVLQDLNLNKNKGIIDFPVEMGRLDPNIDITLVGMEQLCYQTHMIEKPKLLINFLRAKLYDTKINCTMNLMVIGPTGHGKTRLLDRILNEPDTLTEESSVMFRTQYRFRSKGSKKFTLRIYDFPGEIQFSVNQCFLTNRSLYILVWNVHKEEGVEKLKEWLNCLISYVPEASVMIVGTSIAGQEASTHKDQIKQFIVDNPQYRNNLRFGIWTKSKLPDIERKLGKHWFSYVNIHDTKDVNALRKNIEVVACSMPLCKTRSLEDKMLGGSVPEFFFHLKEREPDKKVVLKKSDVQQILEKSIRDQQDKKCCCNEMDVSIEERDVGDAVRFLKDTGHLLHFDDVNKSLNDLYFMDLEWFKGILVSLQKEKNSTITHTEIKKKLKRYHLGEDIIRLIKSFNIGFSISKEVIQLTSALSLERDRRGHLAPRMIKENFKACKARLCRLHVFENSYVPFGLWIKLLSRFMMYIDQLVGDQKSTYCKYQSSLRLDVQTARDLFTQRCHYWRTGFEYNDPDNELYFSVQQCTEDTKDKRCKRLFQSELLKKKAIIETRVISSDFSVCSKLFVRIINHIETALEEWHQTLVGPFSNLERYSPCYMCWRYKLEPPTLYNMEYCFHEFQRNQFDSTLTKIRCDQHPQLAKYEMTLDKMFPDLIFSDYPELLLPLCHQLDIDNKPKDSGGFGIIFEGVLTPCDRQIPRLEIGVKVQKDSMVGDPRTDLNTFLEFKKEAVMSLELADHPYIITLYGTKLNLAVDGLDGGGRLALVMEWAPLGSLSKKLKNEVKKASDDESIRDASLSSFTPPENSHLNRILLYRIAFQIADAVNFMHSLNIYHRDLKPGNVLLISEDIRTDTNVKIADFGTACYASSQGLRQGVGTKHFQAPEMFNMRSGYTFSVDIYALGLIIYQMITLLQPFHEIDVLSLKNIMKKEVEFRKAFKFPKARKDSLCLKKLVERSTSYHLSERQINGQCMIFLLQQPCFQFLMNCFSSENGNSALKFLTKGPCLDSYKLLYVSAELAHLHLHCLKFSKEQVTCSKGKSSWVSHHRQIKLNNDGDLGKYFQNIDEILFVGISDETHALFILNERGHFHFVYVRLGSEFIMSSDTPMVREAEVEMAALNSKVVWKFEFPKIMKVLKVLHHSKFLLLYFKDTSDRRRLERTLITQHLDPKNLDIGGMAREIFQSWEVCQDIELTTDLVMSENFLIICYAKRLVVLGLQLYGEIFEEINWIDHKDLAMVEKDIINKVFLHNNFIIVTYSRTAKVTLIKMNERMQTLKIVHSELAPASYVIKPAKVVSFCGILDTFWFGTSDGYIFILTLSHNEKVIQKIMRPYTSAVTDLVPYNFKARNCIPEFVVSYGTRLNDRAFQSNMKLSHLSYPSDQKEFLLNREFLDQQNSNLNDLSSSDLLLFWHAPNGDELERFNMERDERMATNENLQKVKHRENCDGLPPDIDPVDKIQQQHTNNIASSSSDEKYSTC